MRNPVAILLSSAALIAAVAGPSSAESVPLQATGTVVSRTNETLVVRTDDHGHTVAFAVDRSTVLPASLAVGQRVRVVYHANGAAGQTADTVTLVAGGAPQVDLLASPERTKPGPATASR
jgi:hypothetical protein